MAQEKRRQPTGAPRLGLEGLGPGEDRPEIAVTAWDPTGKLLHSADVADDGSFKLPADALKRAHRIRVGPKQTDTPLLQQVALTYRPADFERLIGAGTLQIGRPIWEAWLLFVRCVTGRVRVCRRSPWWFFDLASLATVPLRQQRLATAPTPSTSAIASRLDPTAGSGSSPALELAPTRLPHARSLDELLLLPFRCASVCQGTVEVYRRTCCCKPWVIADARLPDLIRELEDIVRGIPEVGPIPPPQPGPDPAPWIRDVFFRDGTIHDLTVHAPRDLAALRSLPAPQVASYINARPYLFCRSYSCSAPVKVAEGNLGPDGRFNICWLDLHRPARGHCHDEFAYVVRQRLGPFTITIYNGIAANKWHAAGDDPTLTSYHPLAYGCRDNPGGAFVFLDLIGDTGAHELKTPAATAADSVAAPGYNDGLVFPSPNPAAAAGVGLDRNWGGTLKLSYMFSEGMKALGAKYYRLSVSEANASGNPVGARHYLSAGLSWNKSVPDGGGGVDIVPVVLGPFSDGGQDFLYLIPYDSDADWNDGQYHAYLDTTDARWSDPTQRHLVMLEVFDAAGQRLRPTGTPATGLGGAEGTAAFTYRRRFQETGATDNVPFGALTHMFWWDNRDVFADIVDLRRNGLVFTQECLFFGGTASSTFSVGYRAYHPNEQFQLRHGITWRRGLGSTPFSSGALLPSSSANVGQPPGPPGPSPTNTFHQMLRPDLDPTRTKCAFTVFLTIWNKRTDGDNLGFAHASDTAAFVLEINA